VGPPAVPAATRRKGLDMSVLMSWARSTVANMEHKLGRSEAYFDRILIGVMVALALAIIILFTQAG